MFKPRMRVKHINHREGTILIVHDLESSADVNFDKCPKGWDNPLCVSLACLTKIERTRDNYMKEILEKSKELLNLISNERQDNLYQIDYRVIDNLIPILNKSISTIEDSFEHKRFQ